MRRRASRARRPARRRRTSVRVRRRRTLKPLRIGYRF